MEVQNGTRPFTPGATSAASGAEAMIAQSTAPRITEDHINSKIVDVQYHVFAFTCLTVCAIKLENGYIVTGESACASPENFNAEVGRQYSFRNARQKIWQLEGYLLKESQHLGEEFYVVGARAGMSFGQAIEQARAGRRVARAGWNGKDMWITMQQPDANSKMRQPYLYMSPVGGELVPWLASQADMLSFDWGVVPYKP